MLKKIYSTLPTFREVKFHKGLNIMLADVTKDSTNKDTRNGLGKTTFIQIIDFLFGASCGKKSVFRLPEFENHFFICDYEYKGALLTIQRRGKEPNKVYVKSNQKLSLAGVTDFTSKEFSLKEWNFFLGDLLFNLNSVDKKVYENLKYRFLFSYFIRNANSGGFIEPTEFYKSQKILDTQIGLTYLLGLDTNLAIDYKTLEKRKSELKDLKKAFTTESYAEIVEVSLDSEKAIKSEQLKKAKKELKEFHVHPQYKEIEDRANSLTKEISQLSNKSFMDKQRIMDLKKSFEENEKVSSISIRDLYDEVEIKLPDTVLNKFVESREFHNHVINNRHNYLRQELAECENRVKKNDDEMKIMAEEQSEAMKILKNHGALDQFTLLQSKVNDLEMVLNQYEKQSALLKDIKLREGALKIEEQQISMKITESLDIHEKTKNKAILLVENESKNLYDTTAQLDIGQNKNGRYDIKILSKKQESLGIRSMLIYCFDMMLIQMNMYLGRELDFLIHDSALYDPVDERQISAALLQAKEKSLIEGFQYIVTLNSDDLPNDIREKVNENILDVVLTDSNISGSLMGIQF